MALIKAGFNYEFNALDESGKSNELSDAFAQVFNTAEGPRYMQILKNFVPLLRFLVWKHALRALTNEFLSRMNASARHKPLDGQWCGPSHPGFPL